MVLILTATSPSSKRRPFTGALSLYLDLFELKYRLLSTFLVDVGDSFSKLVSNSRLCLSYVVRRVGLLKKDIRTAFYFKVLSIILLNPSLVSIC
jgi:hypothetical protein